MNAPTLRIARREVLGHKKRSALVMLLIGLPVMLAVAVATVIETSSGTDHDQDVFGEAQGFVTWQGGPVTQRPNEVLEASNPRDVSLGAALAAARELAQAPVAPYGFGRTTVILDDRAMPVSALVTDFDIPAAASTVQVMHGRLPRSAREVAVARHLARKGMAVGDRVSVGNAQMRVVGIVRDTAAGVDVAFMTNAPAITDANRWAKETVAGTSGVGLPVRRWQFVVGGTRPIGADQIAEWNAKGFGVHTPQTAGADEDLANRMSADERQLVAIIAVALVIEVVLLAGPAFAVGARRQRHDLALLAVAGGAPRHLRQAVLLQAALLGGIAGLLGVALGVPAAWLSMHALGRWFTDEFPPLDMPWGSMATSFVLAVAAATLAALLPARAAARADITTTLAGRQPDARSSAGWPVLGAVVLLIGTAGSFGATQQPDSDFANAWFAIVSVIGAVLMAPWLISQVARLGRFLPVPGRLALRDADRHRSRSAPAVAAIMASVSAVTALGIASSSDAAESAQSDPSPYPAGAVTVYSADMPKVITSVKARTGIALTPLVESEHWVPVREGAAQGSAGVIMADARALEAWGITLSAGQRDALDEGRILVARDVILKDGQARLSSDGRFAARKPLTLDATRADLTMGPSSSATRPTLASAVVSPDTAQKLGMSPMPTVRAIADRPASDVDLDELGIAVAMGDPVTWDMQVEAPRRSEYFWVYLALAAAGSIAVLVGTFSATSLALADGRNDFRTLGAVGASPMTKRLVAGAHALTLALVGAALGVAVGMTPGLQAAHLLTRGSPQGALVDIPWLLFALLLVGLPLVSGLVTALASRGPSAIPAREAF